MLYQILFLVVGLVVLIAGGEFLVRGSSRMALRFKLSPLVVGLTIVAFGTSSPELFISVNAALSGSPDMSMGNVIGSNICNLGLVLGLTALFSPISVNKDSIRIDWPVAMGSSLILYALAWRGYLDIFSGVGFVTLLVIYITFLIKKSRRDNKAVAMEEEELEHIKEEGNGLMNWVTDFGLLILGCAGLYFGSEWFVGGAKEIFLNLGMDERIIGIIVLALGTSLPELVTSIVAAIRNNTDLAVGNLIGSNIFNILSILGITSIVARIEISPLILTYDMLWMLGITFILMPLMLYQKRVGRMRGLVLLALYFYYTLSLVL